MWCVLWLHICYIINYRDFIHKIIFWLFYCYISSITIWKYSFCYFNHFIIWKDSRWVWDNYFIFGNSIYNVLITNIYFEVWKLNYRLFLWSMFRVCGIWENVFIIIIHVVPFYPSTHVPCTMQTYQMCTTELAESNTNFNVSIHHQITIKIKILKACK